MQITIRPSQISDLPALRQLSIDSFRNAYAAFNTPANMAHYLLENFSEEKMREELSDRKLCFLLASDNERLVGYVKLNLHPGARGGAENPVEIARLYTEPTLIGKGIGKQILHAVDAYAKTNGHDAVCLDVWQKNFRAINFYQREGFSICGTTRFVLGEDIQDDFIMIKRLP